MTAKIKLHKPCPTCKTTQSVFIEKNRLGCEHEGCQFSLLYSCPLCNREISEQAFFEEEGREKFKCPHCKSTVAIQKIHNLIDNGLIVDHDIRCNICNGPTIHRPDMNLAHRCFFYPNCSGQTDLFGEVKDSFTFVDFETTGLESNKDHIIEIGALKIDREGYEYIFQTLVKPPISIPNKIAEFTGITDQMVENSPEISIAIKQLFEFIGDSKIVAHNADFDMPWLIYNGLGNGLTLPETDVICTLKWARASDEPRGSLSALTKKYGISHNNAHRALADAAATKELFFIFENAKKSERAPYPLNSYLPAMKRQLEKQSS